MIEPGPIVTILPVDYDTAFLYAITCTYNNKYDWRFPTIDEWMTYDWIPNPDWYSDADNKWIGSSPLCIVRTL
jgi:hypothetical protein